MSKVVFCNNDITDIKYSGYTITKVYACGGELVYEYEQPTPTNPIARVYVNDGWIEINDDDSNSAVTSGEVHTWLTDSEYSAITVLGLYDNCKEVGDYAFYNADNLASINSWGVVETIGRYAFARNDSLTSVYLPCHIQLIDSNAFYQNLALSSVTICNSENDVTIGNRAFADCNISYLNLGEKVASIWHNSFANNQLTSVTIPESVSSIGQTAFANNPLTRITMVSKTPPTIYSNTFDNTGNCPIIVPNTYKSVYQSADNWSRYADRIKYEYEV